MNQHGTSLNSTLRGRGERCVKMDKSDTVDTEKNIDELNVNITVIIRSQTVD